MSILCVRQTASERAMLPLSFTKKFNMFPTSSLSDQERENRFGNLYPTLELHLKDSIVKRLSDDMMTLLGGLSSVI